MSKSDIEGMEVLLKRLNALDAHLGVKTMRSAAMAATLPAVQRMKAAAPMGSQPHRTYKKRLVAPGFLRRSIRRVSQVKDGVVSVIIGVRKEAFYGVQFVDRGTKKMAAKPWFKKSFEDEEQNMLTRFADQLKRKILEAVKK